MPLGSESSLQPMVIQSCQLGNGHPKCGWCLFPSCIIGLGFGWNANLLECCGGKYPNCGLGIRSHGWSEFPGRTAICMWSILEYIKTFFEIRVCDDIYYIITKQAHNVSLAIRCKFLFAIMASSLSYCMEWIYAIIMVHFQPLLQIFNIFWNSRKLKNCFMVFNIIHCFVMCNAITFCLQCGFWSNRIVHALQCPKYLFDACW